MWELRRDKLLYNLLKAQRVPLIQMPLSLCLLCLILLLLEVTNNCNCDEDILLNFCCPQGEYDFEKDLCQDLLGSSGINNIKSVERTGPEITSTNKVTIEGNKTLEDAKYIVSPELIPTTSIKLPARLVLDLSKGNKSEFTFRGKNLNSSLKACREGKFLVVLNLTEDVGQEKSESASSTSNHTNGSSLLPSTSIQFTSNGYLKVENDYYSSPEFCIAGIEDEVLTVRVCNATCSGETPCIRKCCPLDEIWNLRRKKKGAKQKCVPAGRNVWEPELYKYPKIKMTPNERENIYPHYKVVHPRTFCKNSKQARIWNIFSTEQRDDNGRTKWKFRISTTGGIFIRSTRYTWHENDNPEFQYCFDGAINSKFWPHDEDQKDYSGLREDDFVVECYPGTAAPARTQAGLYAVLMIISCLFSLLTIAVHIALYNQQPNRSWTLTLISYTTSLFFFYLIFACLHISGFYISRGQSIYLCYGIGVSANFILVSTFCWMSAINYDIFRTFKVLKPTAGKSKGLRKYLTYLIFSVAVPTIIVTVGIVMDNAYGDDFESGVIVPEYGNRNCYLDPEYAQLAYVYGPAGILLLFNVICFLFTIYTMHKIQKSTKFATATSSKKNKQEQSLKLFGKLIFVMGFPWIFEIISWYTEKGTATGNSWYWVVVDVLNIFQAVAIFYIFVCKPDIIHQLEQKYPWFKTFLDRVLIDSEVAQKLTDRHPTLKRFVKPLTRKGKDVVSSSSRGKTESSAVVSSASACPGRDSLEMGKVEPERTPE